MRLAKVMCLIGVLSVCSSTFAFPTNEDDNSDSTQSRQWQIYTPSPIIGLVSLLPQEILQGVQRAVTLSPDEITELAPAVGAAFCVNIAITRKLLPSIAATGLQYLVYTHLKESVG